MRASHGTGRPHPGVMFVATLALLIAGCSAPADSPPSATLRWVGQGGDTTGFGTGVPVSATGEPVSLGGLVICLDGVGKTAELRSVKFETGSDKVDVTSFAVREIGPGQTMLGTHLGPLGETGFQSQRKVVESRCGSTGQSLSELGVELSALQGPKVLGSSLILTYSSGDEQGTARIPLTVVLCVGTTTGSACEP